jgi:transcriptional regulator with XRE-family HTH domain
MVSAGLIVEARRRAGLSQRELARRVGVAQQEIARLERGRSSPSLERLRAIVAACGLELTVGLTVADRSYDAHIRAALAITPAERLRLQLAAAANSRAARGRARGGEPPAPADVMGALARLAAAEVSYVLVGAVAEVLHGSPIIPTAATVTIVPRAGEREPLQAAIAAGGGRQLPAPADAPVDAPTRWLLETCGVELAVDPAPAGTRGYEDLRRDAATMTVGGQLQAPVASLLDLVRIAETSTDPAVHARVVALRRTLELSDLAVQEDPARAA